jgi:predicted 3-demethylubiquinone-9 3-methyltransferase (glyoxalase superfamily)
MSSSGRRRLYRDRIDPRGDDMPRPTPCLWFDTQGEDAARFYTSLFPNSRILEISRYGDANPSQAGQVMVVRFELDGQAFMALNGGPQYTFSEAVSFSIDCADQAEVDRYWNALAVDGGGEEGPCGWLKDRYGLSWQVIPRRLWELISDADEEKAQRVMAVMLEMRKLDIAELELAAEPPARHADGPSVEPEDLLQRRGAAVWDALLE